MWLGASSGLRATAGPLETRHLGNTSVYECIACAPWGQWESCSSLALAALERSASAYRALSPRHGTDMGLCMPSCSSRPQESSLLQTAQLWSQQCVCPALLCSLCSRCWGCRSSYPAANPALHTLHLLCTFLLFLMGLTQSE